MKKGEIKLSIFVLSVFVFLVINIMTTVSAVPECSDGIDNDNDGNIDYLINLEENTQKRILGIRKDGKTDPFLLLNTVVVDINNKKLPYSLKHEPGTAIAHSNVEHLNKICNIVGYRKQAGASCTSSAYENRCEFVSGGNNWLWVYNNDIQDFRKIAAGSNQWLSKITCVDRLPACSDGWDNDNDGKCDRSGCTIKENGVIKALPPDDGCVSDNDDSEFNEDINCCSANDYVESDAISVEGLTLECNDGCDNNGNGLVDMKDPGCTDLDDKSEWPECSDGIDNDGDGWTDFPNDPGCENSEDNSEYTPQCSDGWDNDNDGKIDFLVPIISSYSFDGNANDDVDSNHGTVNGATLTKDRYNQDNKAYKFDGNDYITIDNEEPFDFKNNDGFSISLWLKPDTSSGNIQVPISKMANTGDFTGWNFVINYDGTANSPKKLDVQIINEYSTNRIEVTTIDDANFDGNWHHYVITYDGSSKVNGVKIYEDGRELPLRNVANTLSGTSVDSILNNNKVTIGARENGGFNYKGDIDEVKIWKGVLSETAIKNLYTVPVSQTPPTPTPSPTPSESLLSSLVASYSFDDPLDSDRVVHDGSGNGYHGKVSSGVTQVQGKIGKALQIGDREYFSIDDETAFDFRSNEPFSIAFWLKPVASDTKPQGVITKIWTNNDYTTYKGWGIFLNTGDGGNEPGEISVYLSNSYLNELQKIFYATKSHDSYWHHYVLTYDGSTSGIGVKLYEDGNSLTRHHTIDRLNEGVDVTNNNKLVIGNKIVSEGKPVTADNEAYRYNGLIDELKIWNKALTDAEVSEVYNPSEIPPTPSNGNGEIQDTMSLVISDPGCDSSVDDDETDPLIIAFTKAFWGNTYSDEISETDLKDTVTLNLVGNNLIGKDITYEIYKDNDDGNFDNDNIYYTISKNNFDGNPPIWFSGYGSNKYLDGKYYFKAKIITEDQTLIITSNLLTVNNEIRDDTPTVRIINPEDKQMYFKDEELELLISYDDPDDTLEIKVDLAYLYEKGNSDPVVPYVISGETRYIVTGKGILKIPFKYISAQQKNIEVRVKEGRGAVKGIYTSVLIIDSQKNDEYYVLSYIDKPLYEESFNTNKVSFSAESSYAVKGIIDINSQFKLDCIGGLCPSETKGCPLGNIESIIEECRIPVSNFPSPPENANYDPILFKWNYLIGLATEECNNKDICGIRYIKRFRKPGYYNTKLRGGLNINGEKFFPADGVIFSTFFDNPMCLAPSDGSEYSGVVSGKYYWITKNSVIDSLTDCRKDNGIDYNTLEDRNSCCQIGQECTLDNSKYKCKFPTDGNIEDSCDDFITIDSCNEDNGHPLIAQEFFKTEDPNYLPCGESAFAESCVQKTSCKCVWTDKCVAKQETKWYIDEDGDFKYDSGELELTTDEISEACSTDEGEIIPEHCDVLSEILSDDCGNSGIIIRKDTYSGVNCLDPRIETKEFPCPNIARLGFFSWWNLILAILVLFIIYFFYLLNKKRKNKKSIWLKGEVLNQI